MSEQAPGPSWAAEVIWYRILPERFRNGDFGNDPQAKDLGQVVAGWQKSRWGGDWYFRTEWEKNFSPNFYRSVYLRRYGGDLQGIIDKLDYLQDLGVNGIYLSSIFPAPSSHKFDAECFHHVDENFGPDPEGDKLLRQQAQETDDPASWIWTKADELFLELIAQAHQRQMRVMMDCIGTYGGERFFAFRDVEQHRQASRYRDWFEIRHWGHRGEVGDDFSYVGHFGYQHLPQFRIVDEDFVPPVKAYLTAMAFRWLAPKGDAASGVDGLSFDLAFNLPRHFWPSFKAACRQVKPEVFLAGEITDIDPRLVQGENLDGLLNYPLRGMMNEFFLNKKARSVVREFDHAIAFLRSLYPPAMNEVMLNILSSQDTPRIKTVAVNPDLNYLDYQGHFQRSKIEYNQNLDLGPGTEEEQTALKLQLIFWLTYIGSPVIYYGDEVGMLGANDPDCRQPMLWQDVEYDDISHYPYGPAPEVRPLTIDQDLKEHYRLLIKIRRENLCLMRGDFTVLLKDDPRETYVYLRSYQQEKVIVALNTSNVDQEVDLDLAFLQQGEETPAPPAHPNASPAFAPAASIFWKDLLNYEKIYPQTGTHLKPKIKARWGMILRLL
ncbi:MAG: alpha-glucosidase C-terminal domain-containing protein [Bacteriovoracaceae bacterium]|nr:alpha-glucosidase C-terminal domain-containing protein [Bacteriovoracaceae bacterium]